MKKPLHITIPTPCHEKWEEMTPTEQGAYCKACQKNVIDFTRKTQNEIYDIVSKGGDKMCGRFLSSQIEEPIVRTELNPSWLNWRTIAASLAALVAGEKVTASLPAPSSLLNENHAIDLNDSLKVENNAPKVTDSVIVYEGEVLDATTHEPVEGAIITSEKLKLQYTTDDSGSFRIQLTQEELKDCNFTLSVHCLGYGTQSVSITTSGIISPSTIYLSPMILGGFEGVPAKVKVKGKGWKRKSCP